MKQEESARNLGLTVAAYRDYQQGQLPAGPGATILIAAFHIDREAATTDPGQPLVVSTDRHIELLLKNRGDPARAARELLLVHRPEQGFVSRACRYP